MTQREKYFVYGIGFLVGCALVWGVFWKKEGMDLTPRGDRQLKPWYGRVSFEKTEPIVVDSNLPVTQFERVRVIDDGAGKMVRVVEIFEKSAQTKNRESVIERKVMLADVVRVRFKNAQMALEGERWMKENGFKYEVLSDVLVRLFFDVEEGYDGVGEKMMEMKIHPEWVEAVFPEYVIHYG